MSYYLQQVEVTSSHTFKLVLVVLITALYNDDTLKIFAEDYFSNVCAAYNATNMMLVKGERSDFSEWTFYLNDTSSLKKSWFQISDKSTKPFWIHVL